MDVSLDDYIVNNDVNFHVQISNPNAKKTQTRGRGRGRGMGRGMFQQKPTNQGFKKPLSVTVPNKVTFDARENIVNKKRPLDARNKLVAKAKLSDARTKISNLKASKTGVAKGQTVGNKATDARAMILAKKNARQEKLTGKGTGVVNIKQTSAGALGRTINQDLTTGNFQITRQIGNGNMNTPSVQMTGDNMLITRSLQGTQSVQEAGPLFTKTIKNQQAIGNVQMNARGPVIQLHNEMFEAHPRTQPLYNQVAMYDLEEEEDSWMPSRGSTSEKTLTVKMPQSHMISTRTLPPKKFQMNKITFSSKPDIISHSAPPVAVKRKASQDTMSLTTGKQLRLSGKVTTVKQTRPTATSTQTTIIAKRTKVVKPPQPPVLLEEEEVEDVVISPLQGYRIMISNLHTIVTQDDIIELFGAVGPMKRARMVKQGMAEVVYVQKDDALKAVQKYHNRELDGKAMQVKLLTSDKAAVKQVQEVPAAPVQPSKERGGPLRLGQNIPKKPSENVDLSTLHRALFKTAPNKVSKPVTFTVKI